MQNHPAHSPRFPNILRLWKPAAVIGAGGTAVAVWFEELMMFGDEILALVFFCIVGGIMYLYPIIPF